MRRDLVERRGKYRLSEPALLVYTVNNTLVSHAAALGNSLLISVIILFSPNLAAELEEYSRG